MDSKKFLSSASRECKILSNHPINFSLQVKRADLEEKLQRRDAELMKGDDEVKNLVGKLRESTVVSQGLEDDLRQKNDRWVE